MRTVEKTTKKIIIEITAEEVLQSGFEKLWDDIRVLYPEKSYELVSVIESASKMIMIIELSIKNKKLIG